MSIAVRVDKNSAALNFYRTLVAKTEPSDRNAVITEKLKQYNARQAVVDEEYLGIEFKDEQHMTLFEIEWAK